MHKVLDLFSGIGGFSKGLEDTGGFETVAFCEFDEHARKVLSKHWKGVKQYTDIRELTYEQLQADGIKPTVLTGGFPCQDISVAGKQAGIIGERSSLWSEYYRLIKDVQPTWAIIENVSALRSKGLALVLQNLSEIGYNAEWHCIPCSAIGGLHRRDRIWIIAYPLANSRCTFGQGSIIEGENANEVGEGNANQYQRSSSTSRDDRRTQGSEEGIVAHSKSEFSQWDQHERTEEGQSETKTRNRGGSQGDVGNTKHDGSSSSKESRVYEETIRRSEEGQNETFQSKRTSTRGIISDQSVSDSDSKGLQGSKLSTDYDGQETGGEASTTKSASKPNSFRGEPDTIVKREGLELFAEYAKTKWAVEPNVGRVAYGIPNRVHRLKQLGNSVVPQIPEFLGYCILNYEKIKGETK
tara:strand:+ start:508 stop:1740 length:1233 start_codon:yes stop_codon:yes gene_type:complete